jgi:hypothetical protein
VDPSQQLVQALKREVIQPLEREVKQLKERVARLENGEGGHGSAPAPESPDGGGGLDEGGSPLLDEGGNPITG